MKTLCITITQGLAAAAAAAALTFAAPAHAALEVSLPGDAITAPAGGAAPATQAWYAATLQGRQLLIEPVRETRPSGWTIVTRQATPGAPVETTESHPPALALPAQALLAFRFDDDRALATIGRFRNAIDKPLVLRTDLDQPVLIGHEPWRLKTEHQRRKDGGLLAGSLQLVAERADGTKLVLVPPASGMAFAKQELLWLGRLAEAGAPDLILKRTWLTGEVDHVVVIGGQRGHGYRDPDRPVTLFSSGIEATDVVWRHAGQRLPLPEGRFGSVAFTLGEQAWNTAFARLDDAAAPGVLFDRTLALGDETLRFSVEYQPRWRAGHGEDSSATDEMFWTGPALVKLHYRGSTQVLLQLGALDGGGLRVQAGHRDGQPALEITLSPHYNNGFKHHWVWHDDEQRFVRVVREQAQGC